MILMWQVFISPDVQDFLVKQDKQIEERLRKGLKKLVCDNPFHYLEHLESKGYYKFRLGDYRALVDIDFTSQSINIQVLDHRDIIYKKYRIN